MNQYNRTVWINLGRADGLEPQITFSVYSGDTDNLAKATKKASIEVTQITSDHMAERVVEDKNSDPDRARRQDIHADVGGPASIGTSPWPASSI